MSGGEGREDPDTGIDRRRFLVRAGLGAGAVALGGALVEGVVLEPGRLDVSRHTLGSPGGGAPPVRLAVLADLHLDEIRPLHGKVADALVAAEPDVVLLVGDAIDERDRLPVLRDFLRLLPSGPLRLAALGNWEYWSGVDLAALRRTYDGAETRLLVNEAVEVAPGVAVVGLDDAVAGEPELRAIPRHGAAPLVLGHCPVTRDRMAEAGTPPVAAVLSGHTHGGQVTVAGWAPVLPPGSADYVSGWYRGGGPDLFVSRGLGTSLVPIRLGSVPELALVEWYPRDG